MLRHLPSPAPGTVLPPAVSLLLLAATALPAAGDEPPIPPPGGTAPAADTTTAAGPVAAVQALFDAMARGDSAALRELLLPGARIAVPVRRDGSWTVDRSGGADFIDAVIRTPGLEERMRRPEVRTDGRMATVWAEYAFYLDGRLRHCGVDAFQLFRLDDEWRIQHVAYTRRTEGCESWREG